MIDLGELYSMLSPERDDGCLLYCSDVLWYINKYRMYIKSDINKGAINMNMYAVCVRCTVIVEADNKEEAIYKATNLIIDVPGCEIACAGSKDVEIIQEDNDEKEIYRP